MKYIKNLPKQLGLGIWFLIKISIYLIVLYSVCFTVGLSYGAWFAYGNWNQLNAEVLEVKAGAVSTSAYIERKKKDGSCSEGLEISWTEFEQIPLHLKKSVLAAEDASFYLHPGLDIEAILAALEANRQRNKKAFGASTITQQLAKNLFLNFEKSWLRKGKELGYTLLLEKHLTKDRILELYLNLAQWGPCQFGCEAAAQHFYKKSCEKLSLSQSVNLTTLLASPSKYHPENRKSKLITARRRLIYENLYAMRFLKRDTVKLDSIGSNSSNTSDSLLRVNP